MILNKSIKSRHIFFTLILLIFSFAHASHFHKLAANSHNQQNFISSSLNIHSSNACVLCFVSTHSKAITEKNSRHFNFDTFIYLPNLDELIVFKSLVSNNSERSPPSFA